MIIEHPPTSLAPESSVWDCIFLFLDHLSSSPIYFCFVGLVHGPLDVYSLIISFTFVILFAIVLPFIVLPSCCKFCYVVTFCDLETIMLFAFDSIQSVQKFSFTLPHLQRALHLRRLSLGEKIFYIFYLAVHFTVHHGETKNWQSCCRRNWDIRLRATEKPLLPRITAISALGWCCCASPAHPRGIVALQQLC